MSARLCHGRPLSSEPVRARRYSTTIRFGGTVHSLRGQPLKVFVLIVLVAVFAFLMVGKYWGNDPAGLHYKAVREGPARCDQFRTVTRKDSPMAVAAAEACQQEGEQ